MSPLSCRNHSRLYMRSKASVASRRTELDCFALYNGVRFDCICQSLNVSLFFYGKIIPITLLLIIITTIMWCLISFLQFVHFAQFELET